jgi:hypothetical protein
MNEFNAVIGILIATKNQAERRQQGCSSIGDIMIRSKDWPALWEECNGAIRVLEAAGGIDKKAGLSLIKDCYESCSFQRYGNVKESDLYDQIRALLKSLPDKPEGGGDRPPRGRGDNRRPL